MGGDKANFMKTLSLAMILAVMQAAPPSPQPRTAEKTAGSRYNVQRKNKAEQESPNPTQPTRPSPSTNDDQTSSKQPSQTKHPEPIFVGAVSTMPVDSFWWNRFYVIFTGMLVGIGVVGALLAFRTLGKIERQAIANEATLVEIKKAAEQADKTLALAEKQAENARIAASATNDLAAAARDAAQAVVRGLEQSRNRDRARVKIIVDPINPQTVGNNLVRFRIQNVGFTRAFIINSLGRYLHSESPDIERDDPPNKSLVYDEFIEAGQEFPQISQAMFIPLQPDPNLTDLELIKIRKGEAYLHFYGFVRYKDVYDQIWQRNIHLRWVMRFGLMMEGQVMNWWEPVGPPEDNAETQEKNPN